jgi:ATP/ADP translocase
MLIVWREPGRLAPARSLLFIPIEYWTVIVLALLFWPLP